MDQHHKEKPRHALLFSTDLDLDAVMLSHWYRVFKVFESTYIGVSKGKNTQNTTAMVAFDISRKTSCQRLQGTDVLVLNDLDNERTIRNTHLSRKSYIHDTKIMQTVVADRALDRHLRSRRDL